MTREITDKAETQKIDKQPKIIGSPLTEGNTLISRIPIIGRLLSRGEKQENTTLFNNLIETVQNKPNITREDIIQEIKRTQKEYEDGKGTRKPRMPVLFMIKENNTVELFEDARPGVWEIKRTDGKKAQIYLPQGKLLTLEWDEDFKFWVAYEKETVALPNNPIMDSLHFLQILLTLLANRDSLDVKKLKGIDNIVWTIGTIILIALAIIIVIGPVLHIDTVGIIRGIIAPPPIPDTNTVTIIAGK